MALRKYMPSGDTTSVNITPNFPRKTHEKPQYGGPELTAGPSVKADVKIDLSEVYFLIMHFLSSGPCHRTYGQFWNELLEHQLLPRRYHAWYSRSGARSGDEDDNGFSFPLNYNKLVERYPHIEKDHLVKLLKQLMVRSAPPLQGIVGGGTPGASDVPTLLGSGSFSLLEFDRVSEDEATGQVPACLRWPHIHADQVHGLSLREIGGGFTKHHRAPSIRAACYAIAKPSTMLQKMQTKKTLRGHQNAVYCATFDRSGRYVITGSDDRLVKIWSMETAFCLSSCRGHEGDITDLAVSSNNALVASSSNDCIIRVWRLPDGLPISVLRGHTGAVTAIAFSPRPSAIYQLLSSSDDGTCRIWDARYSQFSPRIYIPQPPDVAAGAGKSNDPSPVATQRSHQILCCAYNANGTVFVTGSSDTYARVWNAFKSNPEDSEQPNHEMDLLSGHENDVNYVQFSGCAGPSRSSTADILKEDNIPKFKNSWFTHDNIVTCSRDGSAIIWTPKSRRSYGKVGRWSRAYHLKVPPPPMPPQPPRGGPRQRMLPTPRGVNMIVWSLDNRFVLAAIMDCRICVWNAVDGSLVHSLTGHSESTYVLDVHPFNPRIAMSAGYDGKTIVWDIWEGVPVRIYEIGRFKLVDGKFSPDGTSIVLSDEVGQIHILATGQGESQKDAKYDQFFLGDYRPLIQDVHGNVLDQETQLSPYRRNMQDLLCDSSMIPYPDAYQNMYQQRRLGALGIEWHPPSVKLAVGPADNMQFGIQDYQMVPFPPGDLDRWPEPLADFVDAMDWEQDNDVQSDDNDSEYNVPEEYSSEGEHGSLSVGSSGDLESSAKDSENEDGSRERLRRSKRKKHKVEVEFMTSSGRRVRRRNLDERDGTFSRSIRTRKSRNGRVSSRRRSSTLKSSRPQRRAARNALSLFSRIGGVSTDGEDEDGLESESSETESMHPDSNILSYESDRSMQNVQQKYHRDKETFSNALANGTKHPGDPEPQTNTGNRKRLVLKLPVRDSKKVLPQENTNSDSQLERNARSSLAEAPLENRKLKLTISNSHKHGPHAEEVDEILPRNGSTSNAREEHAEKVEVHPDLSSGYRDNKIKWGEVKMRTSKRLRLGEAPTTDAWPSSNSNINGHDATENDIASASEGLDSARNKEIVQEFADNIDVDEGFSPYDQRQKRGSSPVKCNGKESAATCQAHDLIYGGFDEPLEMVDRVNNTKTAISDIYKNSSNHCPDVDENNHGISIKLRFTSKRTDEFRSPPSKPKPISASEDLKSSECEENHVSGVPEEDGITSRPGPYHGAWNKGSGSLENQSDRNSRNSILHHLDGSNKMFNVVYKRSKSYRARADSEGDLTGIMGSASNVNHHFPDPKTDSPAAMNDSVRRTRSMGTKLSSRAAGVDPVISDLKAREGHDTAETSKCAEKFILDTREQLLSEDWKSSSKMTVGLRSARNKRESFYDNDLCSLDKRRAHLSGRKASWLLLSEYEDGYRYIPQMGDEVAYLRQGHQEFLGMSHLHEAGPWRSIKGNIRTVEFCKVEGLDYSTLPGSGESCCKLTLEFVDPSSEVYGKQFKMTLPELTDFPDFLVERTRYDAAIKRNWTHRDKCQVWWRSEGEEGGNWWEGRILSIKAKSPEFPDSPWERCIIQYKGDAGQHMHSPWELHDPDSPRWGHPTIDLSCRRKLLSSLMKLEHTAHGNQDYYGVQKLKQVVQKSDFLNRFPVPLSLDVIKRRLESGYYRSMEGVKHDIEVMLSNAQSYFAKSAEFGMKMRRLSDWMMRTLQSLS